MQEELCALTCSYSPIFVPCTAESQPPAISSAPGTFLPGYMPPTSVNSIFLVPGFGVCSVFNVSTLEIASVQM
jgi:hypothetical protein